MFHIMGVMFCVFTAFGMSEQELTPYIIGGRNATMEEIPFIVSLQMPKRTHMCGASIITPQLILTAAHCFFEKDFFYVVAGQADLLKDGTLRRIKEIHIHPFYNYHYGLTYDAAIAKLNAPLTYSSVIKNVELPPFSSSIPLLSCKVAGWGYFSSAEKVARFLKAAELRVYSDSECKKDYWNVKRSMFCAGCGNCRRDSCQGDSGGPLVIGDVLYGIVSYGTRECDARKSGVYTRVPYIRTWIDKMIHDLS